MQSKFDFSVGYSDWTIPLNKVIDSQQEERGNLYVGNFHSGELDCVQFHKIGAVITAAKNCDVVSFNPADKVTHLVLKEALDTDEFNISQYFNETFKFIDAQLTKTNVLVHCFAGCQRSVTIVVAFIIKKWGMEAEEALAYVKERRKIADPNDGFIKQLTAYSIKLKLPAQQQQQQKPIQQQQKQNGTKPTQIQNKQQITPQSNHQSNVKDSRPQGKQTKKTLQNPPPKNNNQKK